MEIHLKPSRKGLLFGLKKIFENTIVSLKNGHNTPKEIIKFLMKIVITDKRTSMDPSFQVRFIF